ncbi:hypothetical protein D5086_032043 [Populus alba]|uniref:Uncharacterized protein n=1 Tax=Populus alba TaxID=43335 RepID=A0ACC4AL45_POPAL
MSSWIHHATPERNPCLFLSSCYRFSYVRPAYASIPPSKDVPSLRPKLEESPSSTSPLVAGKSKNELHLR